MLTNFRMKETTLEESCEPMPPVEALPPAAAPLLEPFRELFGLLLESP